MHEVGHLLPAKFFDVKVTQYMVGFGNTLWSTRRGETEYGVRALPLGAFVRIVGMNRMDDVDPADEARSYRQATFPRRLLVISAGSIMHILIAIVLLFGVYATQGEITAQDEPRVIVGAAAQEFLAAWPGLDMNWFREAHLDRWFFASPELVEMTIEGLQQAGIEFN